MKSVGFKFEEAKKLLSDEHSCLQLINKSRIIVLSPRFIGKIVSGIREVIEREVNLFSDFLEGVLISYSNIKLHEPLSLTQDDKPYLHLHIQADYIVFKPYIGCTLKATVNKVSQDHIGCLVHKHFNASVPRPFKHGNKVKNGSNLKHGDEFIFKVTGVSSSNKVLFIKGVLHEESQLPKVDIDQEPVQEELMETESPSKSKKKKKKKSKKHKIEESEMNITERNETLNIDDKKRKRSHDTDVDSGIVDSDTDIKENESKRLKTDINKNESYQPSTDSFLIPQNLEDNNLQEHIDKKKHKKKKKHKNKNKE